MIHQTQLGSRENVFTEFLKSDILPGAEGVCVLGHYRHRDSKKQRHGSFWNTESSSGAVSAEGF
jgi:hypothetical protein